MAVAVVVVMVMVMVMVMSTWKCHWTVFYELGVKYNF